MNRHILIVGVAPVGELSTDIAGVNEYQAAVIQDDRPASTRIGDVNVANLHAVSGDLPEILDYHARLLITIARIDPDPLAYNKLRLRGGIGRIILSGFVTGIHEYYIYRTAVVEEVKTME